MLARIMNNWKSMCFYAWRDSVREEKHNREVIAKFAFRMKYNGVMRAFDRWQSKCVVMRRLLCDGWNAPHPVGFVTIRSVPSARMTRVGRRYRARQRVRQLLRSILSGGGQRDLRGAFTRWAAHVRMAAKYECTRLVVSVVILCGSSGTATNDGALLCVTSSGMR